MKPIDVTSYVGAGPYLIGMARRELRRAARVAPKPFKKGNIVESDLFEPLGIIAMYDGPDGAVEALEFFPPAQPRWKGKAILGRPYSEVKRLISGDDPAIEEDGAGFTSERLGVGVYAPAAAKDPDEPVESAIVFRRDYYKQTAQLLDELRARLLK